MISEATKCFKAGIEISLHAVDVVEQSEGLQKSNNVGVRDFEGVYLGSDHAEQFVSKILGIFTESVGFRPNRDTSNPRLMVLNFCIATQGKTTQKQVFPRSCETL